MENRERERVRKTIIKYTFLFEQNLRATVDLAPAKGLLVRRGNGDCNRPIERLRCAPRPI